MRTNRIDDAHNSRGGQYLLLRTNRKRTVRGAHKTRDSCIAKLFWYFSDVFCPINNPTEDCLGPKTSFQEVDDEYLAKLEAEIKVLKAIKGFTSTADPKGKWNLQKKKNLLIDHNNTCPKTTLNTFFELLRNSARMCSVEKLLMDWELKHDLRWFF